MSSRLREADAVNSEQRHAARRVVEIQWLDKEQLGTLELAVLLGRHNGANDSSDLHGGRA